MRSPDAELYKDKIELSLDGRQVFYLFFGGAVIACLVFVLGVMVGRRVEARSHVDRGAATSAARDPLTALDQLDATAREDLTFRSALAGGNPESEVDDAIAAIEREREEAEKEAAAAKKREEDEAAAKKAEKAAKKDEDGKDDKDDKKAEARKPEPAPAASPDAGRFTLQLSSFKEKSEAEAFLAEVRGTGYKAYLVEAEVEGKGTWFRVRFGRYESYDAALAAKAEFEKKVQKIAYVTRI